MSWEKVICPKNARLDSPVKFSVHLKGGKSSVVFSMAATVVARMGLKKGDSLALYVDGSTRQLRLTAENGESTRALRQVAKGTRCWVEYPHRPLSKLVAKHVYSEAAKVLTCGKGELIIEIPASALLINAKGGKA